MTGPAVLVQRALGYRRALGETERIHRLRWWTLAVLCGILSTISLDTTVLHVVMPTLHARAEDGGLGASTSQLQWINDGYIVVFAGLLLLTGSLGDRFGRVRFLVVGLFLFGGGSLIGALADAPGQLITGRAVMGLGAALIMPATLSVLSNVFIDDRERRVAIGIWSGVSAVGSVSGPLLGGLLLEHFWWGSVFLINLPVVVVVLVATVLVVPDSRDPAARRLDPAGAVLSMVALVTLLWAIIEAPGRGWTSGEVLAAFAGAAVLLVVFIAWQARARSPMLDLGFFRDPRFSVASATLSLIFFGMYGTSFIFTQYLQGIRGLSPLAAGASVAPQALLFLFVATQVSMRLADRIGLRAHLTVGLAVLACSYAMVALLGPDTPLILVIVVSCLTGLGMGLATPPATSAIMASLPRARAGIGSAMNDTTRQIGGALGVAVLGTILNSHSTASVAVDAAGVAGSAPSLGGLQAAAVTAGAVVVCGVPLVLRYLPGRSDDLPVVHTPTVQVPAAARQDTDA